MPDGFNPHTELARIYTLRELMTECRQRTPKILNLIDEMLDSPELEPYDKIKVMEMCLNRGYGRPRQTVTINEGQEDVKRIKVYIPDNGRVNMPNKVIDADPNA